MKSNVCVVTLDSSRARFFALDIHDEPPNGRLTKLIEIEDLANPDQRQQDHEVFTESRPGLRIAYGGGPTHGTDDRRGGHRDELDRRFATDIVEALARHVGALEARRAVVVASAQMLGFLREAMRGSRKLDVDVAEVKKELSWVSPPELHDRLAQDELLPPRGRLEL